jgi:hypothetical protein
LGTLGTVTASGYCRLNIFFYPVEFGIKMSLEIVHWDARKWVTHDFLEFSLRAEFLGFMGEWN